MVLPLLRISTVAPVGAEFKRTCKNSAIFTDSRPDTAVQGAHAAAMQSTLAIYEALLQANVPAPAARRVAEALESDMTTALATKQDLLALEQRLVGRVDVLGEQSSGQLKAVDERLTGQINTLSEHVAGSIKALDERLTGQMKSMDERLTGQMKSMDERLTGQMEAMNERLTGQMNTLGEGLAGQMKATDARLGGQMKSLELRLLIKLGALMATLFTLAGILERMLG
jgi:hypothetical protein